MALILRLSPSERALRSVDEHPGLVFLAVRDGVPCFAVESRVTPEIPEGASGIVVPGEDIDATFDLDEVLDACETGTEARAVLELAMGAVNFLAPKLVGSLQFESLAELCSFAAEVRDRVDEDLRGRGEPGVIGGGGGLMSPALLRQSESELQVAVVQLAGYNGFRHYHTHDSRHSVAGFPDLVLVRPPRLIFVELKAERGRVSVEQAAWIAAFATVGGSVRFVVDAAREHDLLEGLQEPSVECYVWKPSDWPEIERILSRSYMPATAAA